MKQIYRDGSLPCLDHADAVWSNWDSFSSLEASRSAYIELRKTALANQKNECAYTGLWIGEDTKQIVHIDHFRKKVLYPRLTFCWSNLFAAVKDKHFGADFKDSCIGGPLAHADSVYSEIFSPLTEQLEHKFRFRLDGAIEPADGLSEAERNKANKTIEIFNLNHPELKNRRKDLMKKVREWLKWSDTDYIREALRKSGFSFVVDFEITQNSLDGVDY